MRREGIVLGLAFAAACGARSEIDSETFGDHGTSPPVGIEASSDAAVVEVDDARAPTPPDEGSDAGLDLSADAATDAAIGATVDATIDASPDAPADSGPDSPILPAACPWNGVTQLASSTHAVDEIALDDVYVYFRDSTGVSRVPKAGGPVTKVAPWNDDDWPDLLAFVLDDTGITWSQIQPGGATTEIFRVPKEGGPSTTLATLTGEYFGVTPAGTGSYYSWASGAMPLSELVEVSAAGGFTVVATGLPGYSDDPVQDEGVLWIAAEGGLFRYDGTSFDLFAATPGMFVGFLAFDATSAYFLAGDESNEALMSVPKAGGDAGVLASVASRFGMFTLDADSLYVTNRFDNTITRMNKDGSDAVVIAQGVADEQGLGVAVDDRCVYWTGALGGTTGTNHVYAAPKTPADGGD